MRKSYRRFLRLLAITIFLLLSPVMVLYAVGYRLSDGEEDTIQVGALIVESVPRRADIYINGQYRKRTPNSITNLSPGEIRLAVKKKSMTTWEKNIAIKSGVVTEARDIHLFPRQRTIKTIAANVLMFAVSPNRNLIAAVDGNNQLILLAAEDGAELARPIRLKVRPDQLLWSPDSSFIALVMGKQVALTDIRRVPWSYNLIPSLKNTTHLVWDERIPGRLQAINARGELIFYNLSTKVTAKIAAKVKYFATSSRYIYVLRADGRIEILNLQGVVIDTLRLGSDKTVKELRVTPGGRIVLLLVDNSLSYLTADNNLRLLARSVNKFGWSPDEQVLFLQLDDTSLYVINLLDERLSYVPLGQVRLVTRLSRPIRNPQWFAGGRHLIYQVDDEIFITEIDTRDRPISYVVDSTNLGNALVTVGSRGDNVLYLKKTGQHNRLVKTNLREEQ